jgi:hypothetical protein
LSTPLGSSSSRPRHPRRAARAVRCPRLPSIAVTHAASLTSPGVRSPFGFSCWDGSACAAMRPVCAASSRCACRTSSPRRRGTLVGWSKPCRPSARPSVGTPGPGWRPACRGRPVRPPGSAWSERLRYRPCPPDRRSASTRGPGGGVIALAPCWSSGRRLGSWICGRTARLRPSRPGSPRSPASGGVCRDRRDLDADGMRQGAPQAVQGVDRWPLVHTLRHALAAFLSHHRAAGQAAALGTAPVRLPLRSPGPVMRMYQGRRQRSTQGPLRAEAARASPRPTRRGLAGGPDTPRPGHAHGGYGPRPRYQPPDGLRRPAARRTARPHTTAMAAIGAGIDARHSRPAPPLVREGGRQQAALAREAGAGLDAFRPDGLPREDPAAARWRARRVASAGALAVHPLAGPLRLGTRCVQRWWPR